MRRLQTSRSCPCARAASASSVCILRAMHRPRALRWDPGWFKSEANGLCTVSETGQLAPPAACRLLVSGWFGAHTPVSVTLASTTLALRIPSRDRRGASLARVVAPACAHETKSYSEKREEFSRNPSWAPVCVRIGSRAGARGRSCGRCDLLRVLLRALRRALYL